MDISDTLAPKSDQLDNIDLRGGDPRIFTVTKVDVKLGAEQPVAVHFAEFDRPWKPGKNMRRVISHCWTRETDNWVGGRVELFSDERIKFGNDTPGGTRISRISGIDGPQRVPVMLSQGRPGTYKVDPLPATTDAPTPPPEPTAEEVAACIDQAELRKMWDRATSDERREQIKQRKADLDNEPEREGES